MTRTPPPPPPPPPIGDHRSVWVALRNWLPLLGALPFLLMAFSSARVAYDDHITPCEMILEDGRLPAVEACWECHQPPLYYLLGADSIAAARAVTGERSASVSYTALKLLGLLFALGTLLLISRLVRRFFPERPGLQALCIGLVLVTPLFLLTSILIGNDVAVLFFCTLALAVAAVEEPVSLPRSVALGAVAGLAVLSKYNGFAVVPAVGVVLLWPLWRGEERWRPGLRRVIFATAAFLVLTGPWFLRNVITSGSPIPTRMERVERMDSVRYDLVRVHPIELLKTPFRLSERLQPGETLPYRGHQDLGPADRSLWTKTYALWWADALYYLAQPAPPWTAARYVAAFPVCLVALLGLVVGWVALVRRRRPAAPGAGARVATLVLAPVLLGLYFVFVARYPWVRMGHGRASFLVPLLAPFALSFGLGFAALTDGRPRWIAGALLGLFGVLAVLGSAYAGFLVLHYF